MEILSKILGNSARVRLMRLFLLNQNYSFSKKEIIKRTRVNVSMVNKEIKLLSSVEFIKKHDKNWVFDPLFKYAKEFDRLLVNSDSLDRKTIADSFKRVGKVKLLLI